MVREAEVAADAAVRDVQRELRDVDAEIKLMPRRSPCAGARRAVRRARQPVSVLPLTRGAVDSFDHPGLFIVALDRSRAMAVALKTLETPAMRPWRRQVAPPDRHKRTRRRYCSGCAQETEHIAWAANGRGSIPAMRRPTTEPAIGTTICMHCGQRRAPGSRPNPPAWSSWPRSRIATRGVAIAAYVTNNTTDDWVSESAAEDEGMPPKREPRAASA